MKLKNSSLIVLVCSGFMFSQTVYAQTLTFEVKEALTKGGSYCELSFDIVNHTELNITQIYPEFTLKYQDGLFLENLGLMAQRLRPSSTTSTTKLHNTACNQIGSIEFGQVAGRILVDGKELTGDPLQNFIDGIAVRSSISAIKAP